MSTPRRCRIDLMTPAELAIRNAVLAVESLPAGRRLTEAVIMLAKAQDMVADYVDGISHGFTEEQHRAIADAIFDNNYTALNRLKAAGKWISPTPEVSK